MYIICVWSGGTSVKERETESNDFNIGYDVFALSSYMDPSRMLTQNRNTKNTVFDTLHIKVNNSCIKSILNNYNHQNQSSAQAYNYTFCIAPYLKDNG